MDFSFTEDQQLLRESMRALLAAECTPSLLRAHMEDVHAIDALWSHVREYSPLGTGPMVDLCVVMEELGYVAASLPFFTSAVLAGPVLRAADSAAADAVVAGELSATLAVAGADGVWRANAEPTKTFVQHADNVDTVVVVDADGGVALLDHPPVRRVVTLDTTNPVFDVDTSRDGTAAGVISRSALEGVLERATVALAAEMVGTARRLLEMSLTYAKERTQFDVPIGSFQAIQHKLADMSLDVERAWGAVYYAAMTVDADDDDRHRAAHVAKAAAGEAAKRNAKDGIQIHGGIGFTWEHDLHLFLRRAFTAEALLGSTGWHHDRLADLLI
jgi:alkylation response protein AidB-like acyl-CoA dehydrogenase